MKYHQNAAVPGGNQWFTGQNSNSDAVTALRFVNHEGSLCALWLVLFKKDHFHSCTSHVESGYCHPHFNMWENRGLKNDATCPRWHDSWRIYSVMRWDYSGAEWHHGRNMAFWRIHKFYFLIWKIDRTLRQVVEQLNEIIQVPGAVCMAWVHQLLATLTRCGEKQASLYYLPPAAQQLPPILWMNTPWGVHFLL